MRQFVHKKHKPTSGVLHLIKLPLFVSFRTVSKRSDVCFQFEGNHFEIYSQKYIRQRSLWIHSHILKIPQELIV